MSNAPDPEAGASVIIPADLEAPATVMVGLTNPAHVLLEVIEHYRAVHGEPYSADRRSFLRCAERCSPHPDLEAGFELANLNSDIRTLACMGNFRVHCRDFVLTLEHMSEVAQND